MLNMSSNYVGSLEPQTAVRQHVVEVETPSFLFDEAIIVALARSVTELLRDTPAKILYPVKPFSQVDALRVLSAFVSGFAVSSPFEAKLVREVAADNYTVHFTSPGLRQQDLSEIAVHCDYVSFNSLSQLSRGIMTSVGTASIGLRVNPGLSYVEDIRYDPCRPHSKLGVPLDTLRTALMAGEDVLRPLEGIQFHSNCESIDFGELLRTVQHLDDRIGRLLQQVDWINLGGGYLFKEGECVDALRYAIDHLHERYGLNVFVEPGTALIRGAGYVVSSVVDIFDSDGVAVAVLDTTVNHMPEVFEYRYEPDVVGHSPSNEHEYLLAGATCLAGDLFGTYRFERLLEVGSRVVFENVGAYTLVKAHMFNGINLPSIYALTSDGELVLKKRFTYEDFAQRWRTDAPLPV